MVAWLLAAGAPGKRHSLPNSRVLLHQPLIGGVMEGTATDLGIQAQEMIDLRKRMYQIMHEHTGQPIDRISKDCDRDKWLSSAEAQEYGIVDEVLKRLPDDFGAQHESDD